MSNYPYTGPYSTTNQPGTYQTGTGLGTTGTTGTTATYQPSSSYGTTGLSTGLGTGLGTGVGTGLQHGYVANDPHYIPSSTLGTHNLGQQPVHHKRKHRPQSRSSSSSSSSNEEKRAQKGQKKGFGQKLKQLPGKVKQMVTGHHPTNDPLNQPNPNYPQ